MMKSPERPIPTLALYLFPPCYCLGSLLVGANNVYLQ